VARRGPKPKISQAQILETATALVQNGGLSALSMSALARELGTAVSGLYRYFDSLEMLLLALQVRAIAQYELAMVEALTKIDRRLSKVTSVSARQIALLRVLAVFRRYLTMNKTHPAEQALVDAFLSSPAPVLSDDSAAAMNRELGGLFRTCSATLEHAVSVKALSPGDSRQRTYVIWAGLHGLEHFRKRDRIQPRALRVSALESVMLKSLLLGFGAKPSEVDRAFDFGATRKK
jgi:AcrR family transcriptional regulator